MKDNLELLTWDKISRMSKESRAKYASSLVGTCIEQFYQETALSVRNTTSFDKGEEDIPNPLKREVHNLNINFVKTDTVSALLNVGSATPRFRSPGCFDTNTLVLNFASYRHPGGGFLNGHKAQEEALCFTSNLYLVLREFDKTWYTYNRKSLNDGLYNTRLLVTPDILFFAPERGSIFYADVVTCAAPNATAALKHGVSPTTIESTLYERCDAVLYAATRWAHKSYSNIILGAFGCGVFGNDIKQLAKAFQSLIYGKYAGCFQQITFAVPDAEKLSVLQTYMKR